MTDIDTTIREAQEWARAIINPGLSQQGGLLHVNRLLAVIEQQQATIERFEASNRYGDQMILAQSDVIGELNNDVSDLRATINRQAETLRQVREYALAHVESAGHPELGGAESQIGRDILRILDAGGEGS
ncbi:hypothetical protein [Gordonia aichiensis]